MAVTRYRLTVVIELDTADPAEARLAIFEHTEELRAALDVSSAETVDADAEVEDADEHAFLDAIEAALTGRALADGTPVLAELDAVDRLVVIERRAIVRALHATGGHIGTAATCLGLGRNTLYKKVHQYDIDLAAVRAEKGRSA